MVAIFSSLLLFFSAMLSAQEWCTEENAVLSRAAAENKPIVLACIGSDLCPWSQKMYDEILSQNIFSSAMKEETILWLCCLRADGDAKEEKFREKYKIEECPVLLLLDPKGREFARFEYLPLEPQIFADHLLETVSDFKEVCIALTEKRGKKDPVLWQELYHKSQRFSSLDFKKRVLERGIAEDPGIDLLLEKYALVLQQNGQKSSLAKTCKKHLIARDPDNHLKVHFKIAMAEFHAALHSKKNSKKVLKPLMHYLAHFQDKDQENIWNVEMAIAQFFFNENRKPSALDYAKRAYSHCPESMQEEIAASIAYIASH
jgi:protein disulfide-isomerase